METPECNICFEPIDVVNNSTTACGHRFCFGCIAKSMQRTNTCPCCRSVLYERVEYEVDYNDTTDIFMDNIQVGCVDSIAEKLEDAGVTMIDVLAFYTDRYNSKGAKYQMYNDTWLYTIEWLEDIIPRTIREVDDYTECNMREQYDRWLMRREDKNQIIPQQK